MTFIKKEKESGKLRMGGGSWTINLSTLPQDFDLIKYITEAHQYEIKRQDAFSKGWIMRTKQNEEKLVVPIKFWSVK